MKYSVRYTLLPAERKDGTHTIRMRVSWAGIRITHYLSSSVPASGWDTAAGMPKRTYPKALREISSATAAVDRVFDLAHVDKRIPTKEDLRIALGDIESSSSAKNGHSLLLIEAMDSFAADSTLGGGWSDNTQRNFRTLRNSIEVWRPDQTIEGFGRDDMESFMNSCYDKGLVNVTVQKFMKQLRWVVRTAMERGLCSSSDAADFHPHYRTESESDVVFLTKEELRDLMEVDVSHLPHLDRVRDVFLFCCFSGLRYSDAARLTWNDIHEDHFRVLTKKTNDPLRIELNKVTSSIIDKYSGRRSGDGRVLPIVSNQKMNEYLKDLARMAGIDDPVRRVWWVRSERHEELVPKWKVLTSHCGRKTFVVSALSLDIASEVIMRWTGHKNHKTMKPYIAIVDDIKKKSMSKFDMLADKMTDL